MWNKKFEDIGGVNDSSPPTVHIKVVPRDKAIRERESKMLIGGKVSFLNTNNIMILDKTIKGIGNRKTTLKSTRTRRIKRKTTNVVREDTREGEGRRRQRGRRKGNRRNLID